MNSNGVILDPDLGISVYNETDFSTRDVLEAASADPMIAALYRWVRTVSPASPATRAGGLFDRDRYVSPHNVFDQMRLAYEAAESDDVVSGVLDATESLALSRVDLYAEDPDEEDVYNQVAADINLDGRLREMWRELFCVSQFVAAVWWQTKTYKVRGKTGAGVRRKKELTIRCPQALTLLDPLKVVPVGSLLFNREQLAYVADNTEADILASTIGNRDGSDPIVERLFLGPYEPDLHEQRWLSALGINQSRLFLLNPENVFRHTATRSQYQPFPTVRMKSVFELLDLKHQLRQMDRAHLLGGTNFIVLVTKGTDAHPARPQEITNLQSQVRTVARVPVLVGDHRLNVEIVTPKLDNTLKPERYNALDARITARLYQLLVSGAYQAGTTGDDSIKLAKVIARGLESRRHMIRRTLERFVLKPMYDKNDVLTTAPKLQFHPKSIDLSFDAAFASFLLDLRETREISRETILSQFDLDQDDEARMLERERESYDEIFQTTVPFDAPQNNQRRGPAGTPMPNVAPGGSGGGGSSPKADPSGKQPVDPGSKPATKAPAGDDTTNRRAGRRQGGAAPGSGQGQAPRRVRRKSE